MSPLALIYAAQVAAGTWALLCLATVLVLAVWRGMCWVTARRATPATRRPDAGLDVLDQADGGLPAPVARLAADPIDMAIGDAVSLCTPPDLSDAALIAAHDQLMAGIAAWLARHPAPPVIPGREDQP